MSVSDFRAYALGKTADASAAKPKKKTEAKVKPKSPDVKLPIEKSSTTNAKNQAPGKPVENATAPSSMPSASYRESGGPGEIIRIGPPNKMGAKRVYATDGTFDSMEEHKRWCDLKLLARGLLITDLRRQVKYSLDAGGIHISNYVADFVYLSKGDEIVEDSKGFKTPEYRQKRRLMKEILGIEIIETGKSTTRPAKTRKAPRG